MVKVEPSGQRTGIGKWPRRTGAYRFAAIGVTPSYWRNDDIAAAWKLNATTTDTGNNAVLRHLANDPETTDTQTHQRR